MSKSINHNNFISRRDFLKLSSLGAGTLALHPFRDNLPLSEIPQGELLGRNCTGGIAFVRSRPDVNSTVIKEVYEDTVFPWLREVSAINNDFNVNIQRWVETPEGYVYAPSLQPVHNSPNEVQMNLPDGKPGFWAEVTVPYIDVYLENPPARSPGLKYLMDKGLPTRLYYSQVMWIDQIKIGNSGKVIYHVNEDENHGFGYGDVFWAEGFAFRPLTAEEVSPISPDVDSAEKFIKINLTYQTLSCYENEREVYFCRISSGAGDFETPTGEFVTWRKAITIHMAAGTVDAGYDTPGVSWSNFFVGTGVAIHATFWHNEFGQRRSHGCVNCRPEDAKWIFRWTTPSVSLEQSDVSWTDWQKGSTRVIVEKRLF